MKNPISALKAPLHCLSVLFLFNLFTLNTKAQTGCEFSSAATNLLVNGSFENGTTGWGSSGGAISINTTYTLCGTYSGHFGWSSETGWVWQDIPDLPVGTNLTLRAYAGTHTWGQSCSPRIYLTFYSSSWTIISQVSVNVTADVDVSPFMPSLFTLTGTVPAGTKYTSVEASITGDWLKLDGFSLTANSLLPVRIAEISGRHINGTNQLSWKTTGEENLLRYDIEHSTDGRQFNTLGSVFARNMSGEQVYNYNHTLLRESKNYYRLKLVDRNGGNTYSNIITVVSGETTASITTFPNPFNQQLSVQLPVQAPNQATLKLINAEGKIMASSNYQLNTGNNLVTLNDLASLPSGLYMLEVWLNGKRQYTGRVTK